VCGQGIHGGGPDAAPVLESPHYSRSAVTTLSLHDALPIFYALCSGDDDGEFRSGNHGGNADGQLGDGGHGGREHRSGGSHRKPGRDDDNGGRRAADDGGQGIQGGGGDAAAESESPKYYGSA